MSASLLNENTSVAMHELVPVVQRVGPWPASAALDRDPFLPRSLAAVLSPPREIPYI